MTVRTSRVFACWTALYNRLDGVAFTAHSKLGKAPDVTYGVPDKFEAEAIVLPGRLVEDPPSQEWATQRGTKDEKFQLVIDVVTDVPGSTAVEARTRVAELAAAVEGALRNASTGVPSGLSLTFAADGVFETYSVVDTRPAVYPLTRGFGARCRLLVGFHARL